MTFSRRMATLAAVVLIPVAIAGTSYLLTEDPEPPSVPSEVELDETQREQGGDQGQDQDGTRSPSPSATPTEEVVPRPSASEGSIHDDDQDGAAEDDRGDRDDGEADNGGNDSDSDLDDRGGGDG
jgi:hypothetical protein